jgi:hypothetical protein
MTKTTHFQWLAAVAVLLLAAGCPVDINEGMGGGDDGGGTAECMASELATVRFMHAAGGTPVTRRPGVTSTRNLNVTRPDPEDPAETLTVTSLAAGRASIVQLCGNRPLMFGARLAGAAEDRVTVPAPITLTPDADPTRFDVGTTIILAGISDALKEDGVTPENPKSAADPLRFIVVLDMFGTGPGAELQVVHASRRTPAIVDVEANPESAGPDIEDLDRYAVSMPVPTRGTPDTAPVAVSIQFLDPGTTTMPRASFSISPRMPAGAKGLAIHFDTEVFDPDHPSMDPAMQNPAPVPRLFLTGDDPLLGSVAGGGITF